MIQVTGTLYPARVLDLKKAVYDQKINLDKLRNVSLKLKNIDLEKSKNDLNDIRQLHAKNLAEVEAVKER